MNLLLCQTVRDLCTGIPASRSPQRKAVSWTVKWDRSIRFWSRGTAQHLLYIGSNLSQFWFPAKIRSITGTSEHPNTPPENADVYLRELRPNGHSGRYCWRRQHQPKRSGAMFPILPGVFSSWGAHSVPPSNSAAFAAGSLTDSAGDPFCLRVPFRKLLQPSISQKVRIFPWGKTQIR